MKPHEMMFIKRLWEDTSIMIKAADKSVSIVIMDTEKYKQEILRQLGDTNCYAKLDSDPTWDYKSTMDKILSTGLKPNWINQDLFDYLTVAHPTIPVLYTLPKIHKNLENVLG